MESYTSGGWCLLSPTNKNISHLRPAPKARSKQCAPHRPGHHTARHIDRERRSVAQRDITVYPTLRFGLVIKPGAPSDRARSAPDEDRRPVVGGLRVNRGLGALFGTGRAPSTWFAWSETEGPRSWVERGGTVA